MLKKALFHFILLFITITCVHAQNRYWVGGSGNWNDSRHWANSAQGKGGAAVPTINDNVFFTKYSFKNPSNAKVTITNNAYCKDFNWQTEVPVKLGGINTSKFIITGKTQLNENFQLDFRGAIKNYSARPFTVTVTEIQKNKCAGDTKSILVATVTGGTGPFNYQWGGAVPVTHYNIASFTDTLKNLGPQTLNLVVVDKSNLSSASVPFINVFSPSAINPVINPIDASCFQKCDGSISVIPGGGTPPYKYSWSTGDTIKDIQNLCKGSYTLTITDSNACIYNNSVPIEHPLKLEANPVVKNISCNGVCDGSITANPSGGTGPYTHSWSNGFKNSGASSTISSLCPGTYADTIRDSKGCETITTHIITQPVTLSAVLTSVNVKCFGDNTGSIDAVVNGGTLPIQCTWSQGGSVISTSTLTSNNAHTAIFNLSAGAIPYQLDLVDNNGCTKTYTVIITQPTKLTGTVSKTDITCNGKCDGTLNVSMSGGTGSYSYLWMPGNYTMSTVTNLCPATYTLTVLDSLNCDFTTTVQITEPDPLKANKSNINASCFGICDGIANVNPTGGTFPYNVNWTPVVNVNSNKASYTNLCAGKYNVTIIDARSCLIKDSVYINQPPDIIINATQTNVTCFGACNGQINVSATGGSGTYTYKWSGGLPDGQNKTNLCAGSYTLTVTDNAGCIKSQSFTITQPNDLNISLAATNILCNGSCNATISSTISGGTPMYTLSWAPGGETTSSLTNQCAGNYTLTVTDRMGCIKSVSKLITQPTQMNLNVASTDVKCFGDCNGSASAIAGNGTPPYQYSWSPGGGNFQNINNLCPGPYKVTATDNNGCNISKTITINQPNQLHASPVLINPISCAGGCDGVVLSKPTGGTAPYNFNWSPNVSIKDTAKNLCIGNYQVTVTDFNSCTSTEQITLTQPTPVVATISGSSSSCNVCTGSASVTAVGGTGGPYTYYWSPAPGAGQGTVNATGLCPNQTYTVTVTDGKNCSGTATVRILQTVLIDITTSSTTLSCKGLCDGTATANASGGTAPYKYLWKWRAGGNNFTDTTQSIDSLCVGTYTITVTDRLGCFNTDSVTFTDPPALNVTVTKANATCYKGNNGSANAVVSGGTGSYTYLWMPGAQTGQTVTGLLAGTYTLTVKDSKQCKQEVVFNIGEGIPVVDHVVITTSSCTTPNGSIEVNPTGGQPPYNSYTWGPGSITGNGTNKATGLPAGAYTLTFKDNAGCSYNFNYLVNNANAPTLTMNHTNITCNNACNGTATVTATGGAGSYNYTWLPSGGNSSSATGLCGTTTYTVKVIDGAGCTSLDTVTLFNPTKIIPNEVITQEKCFNSCNGIISLNPTGGKPGYSYVWSTGAATPTITGLCASNYSVKITDQNLCTTNFTFTVSPQPKLSIAISSNNVLCKGLCNGKANAVVSGGVPTYQYSWSNQPVNVVLPNIVNLCPNKYVLTVKDANGCIAKDSVIITEPDALTSVVDVMSTRCYNTCSGSAKINAMGGTAPYHYTWASPAPNKDTMAAINLCAGTYSATVTDANNCKVNIYPIRVNQPGPISPNVTTLNPLCNTSCDGSVTSNAIGGNGNYKYNWMPGNITTKKMSGLCAGTYSLTITDTLGCIARQNVTLVSPSKINITANATATKCKNNCTGTLSASATGGVPGTTGYTYLWMPLNNTKATVNNVCTGNYKVIVKDKNACTDSLSVSVASAPPMNLAVSSTPSSCNLCDGTITVNPIAAVPTYQYIWTPTLPNQPYQVNLCAGIYKVKVIDGNNCDSTFTISLNNSNGPTGETITKKDVTCNGVCNGQATITPIGGVKPYKYLWNTSPAIDTLPTAKNLCAKNYLVQITDSNQCKKYAPLTISQPQPIKANATITAAVCKGVCTGSITIAPTGGLGSYKYKWMPGNVTTQNLSNVCPGTYTLTITDDSLCVKVDSFTVGETTPLKGIVSVKNIPCFANCTGQAVVTITSGTAPYTIQWDDPLNQTKDTAKKLCEGTYSVKLKDNLGCNASLSTNIIKAPQIILPVTVKKPSCNVCNGEITVNPSGGDIPYQYTWSNGQTTATANNLCAGMHSVYVEDKNGCSNKLDILLSNNTSITGLTINKTDVNCNGSCNGQVTSVTTNGGTPPYKYLWLHNGSTTTSLTNLCAGTYYIQVTDSTGCKFVDSVKINQPAAIAANAIVKSISACAVCDGSIEIHPSGGTSPYNVLWSNGSTDSTLVNLCSGIYTVDITDVTSCTKKINVALNGQGGPAITTTSTNLKCKNVCIGTAKVLVNSGIGPYQYKWSGSVNATDSISNLCAGTHLVSVTDANLCVSISSVKITEPVELRLSQANKIDPSCNGDSNGSVSLIPSGGTMPYNYSWNPPVSTGINAVNLKAGTYNAVVKDNNGCEMTQSIVLIEPAKLAVTKVLTPASCNTIPDGKIDIIVTGGTPLYSYKWIGPTPATTQNLTSALSGSYILTVTDAKNCVFQDTSNLTSIQFVLANAGKDTVYCFSNDSIKLNAAKSINAVNFNWYQLPFNTLLSSKIAVNVKPTVGINNYYVKVDNGTGCSDADTVMVTQNELPFVDAGLPVSIFAGMSRPVGANPLTTAAGAKAVWKPFIGLNDSTAFNPVVNPTKTTLYKVTVTSLEGCINSDSVLVTVLPKIIIPDGITPNGDGANDVWLIDGIEIFKDCMVEVYNRWGELLFQSPGYRQKWDGSYKGKLLPVGTYYYVIDLKDPIAPNPYTGPITIMR